MFTSMFRECLQWQLTHLAYRLICVKDPFRPDYAIGPRGDDCQEWTYDDVFKSCSKSCISNKKMSVGGLATIKHSFELSRNT
jgi:hypothetical protein